MSVSTMKKLTVFSSEKDSDAILRKLMNLRCVQIEPADVSTEALQLRRLRGAPERCEELEAHLEELSTAIAALTPYTLRKKGLGRRLHRVDRAAFLADGRAEAAEQAAKKVL